MSSGGAVALVGEPAVQPLLEAGQHERLRRRDDEQRVGDQRDGDVRGGEHARPRRGSDARRGEHARQQRRHRGDRQHDGADAGQRRERAGRPRDEHGQSSATSDSAWASDRSSPCGVATPRRAADRVHRHREPAASARLSVSGAAGAGHTATGGGAA